MRHRLAGRHLGRDTAHRKALYRNLVTDLLRYERITTTEAKAKEIRPMAERIITLGKRGDLHARRQALRFVYDPKVVKKVFDEIGPRMRERPGGYTRITALEPRKGDNAKISAIELVDFVDAPPTPRPNRVTASPVSTPAAARTTAPAAAAAAVAELPEAAVDTMTETESGTEAEVEAVASAVADAPATSDTPDAEGESEKD